MFFFRSLYLATLLSLIPPVALAQHHQEPIDYGDVTKNDLCNILPDAQCHWASGEEFTSFVTDGDDIALETRHEPTPGGGVASSQLSGEWTLPIESSELWFSYQIFFAENFDFANGGKIRGIGGGSTPSGGGGDERNGASLRIMFKNGTLKLYAYHLGMEGEYGDYFDTGFPEKRGEWIQVAMRADAGSAEHPGFVQVYIDGELLVSEWFAFKGPDKECKPLTEKCSYDWKMNKALLSAFHGGSGKEPWIPANTSTTRVKNFKYGSHQNDVDL